MFNFEEHSILYLYSKIIVQIADDLDYRSY